MAGAGTRQIDARGGLILPGMCDARVHFHWWSVNLRELNLAKTRSRAEFLAMIAARSHQSAPADWITGGGWNESWWGELHFPTAAELDQVTRPGQPALLYRSDMHCAVVNSAALRLAGIDAGTPNPPGWRHQSERARAGRSRHPPRNGGVDRAADASPASARSSVTGRC